VKDSVRKARLTHLAVLAALIAPVVMGGLRFLGFSDGIE
jgi:hypothetical protein